MNINESFKQMLMKLPYFPGIIILRLINWLFQGMLFASRTEKFIKIMIDLILTLIFTVIIISLSSFSIISSMIIAFILAHSFNWIFATNIWSVRIKNSNKTNSDGNDLMVFLLAFQKSLRKLKSIHGAAIFGSMSTRKFSGSSDVDIKVFRKAGISNLIRSYLFLFLIRTKANFSMHPIDIYVEDSMSYAPKKNEIPIIIHDPDSLIRKSYKNTSNFETLK